MTENIGITVIAGMFTLANTMLLLVSRSQLTQLSKATNGMQDALLEAAHAAGKEEERTGKKVHIKAPAPLCPPKSIWQVVCLQTSGIIMIAIGASVVTGTIFNFQVMTTFGAGPGKDMAPSTAVCFILIGISKLILSSLFKK